MQFPDLRWTYPPSVSVADIAKLAIGALILYEATNVIYNLYFHPLSRFPGPLLHRAKRLTYVIRFNQGKLSLDLLKLHAKYGPVVRIAPNELAFEDPDAFKDVYGRRTGIAPPADEMTKPDESYHIKGEARSIMSEGREKHALLRRQLASGFSERAMREQEPIIGGYIDLLIRRLREYCVDRDSVDPATGMQAMKEMNMTSWYAWTTFDVIGDLAFGEPFGCLERAKYDPWVAAIGKAVRFSAVVLGVKFLGYEFVLRPLLRMMNKYRREHNRLCMEKLQRRAEMTTERPDLIEGLLKKRKDWGLDINQLMQNSSNLIIAGSETTATALTGVTYLLLKNPDALRKVVDEVRSSFTSEEEITLLSVSSLTYMLACLNEALRLYPPIAVGLPRIVPKGGAVVAGVFVPEDSTVSVWHWAVYHSDKLWTKPFAFRPERFLHDPKYANDKLDALQPFSVGPRNCLGRNLAYAEMRLILARILYNFDMQLANEDEDWLDQRTYILWAKPALNVYMKPVAR
ncbi:cytochrome P450 [Rhizodiscina lignyota]|uniref:Cytochrome P450 n=1 Tax=Rhizodiscina lignyota TaxID=1504668 RepID=A0A9P4IIJ2_9PEZI|nr:cytochrome P450 [Rhizodiscina lignyota]